MRLIRIIGLVGLLSCVAQVYALSDGIWTYEINSDLDTGSATITGCALKEDAVSDIYRVFLNGNCPSEDLVIPAYVDGYSVTEVGELAFYESDWFRSDDIDSNPGNRIVFTSVAIPSTVLRIGNGAFKNNSLTELSIPDSVVTIGPSAFASNRLVSFTFPENLTSFPEQIFFDNKLVGLVIPEHIQVIGNSAFRENFIENIVWPSGPLEIGPRAFMNNRLTEINIPESVGIIGDSAFANNSLETLVFLGTSRKVIGSEVFAENDLKSVVLPPGIETIEYRAFFRNQLESVVIPDSVKSIGESAFYINRLVELTLPDSVTTLGRSAFRDNALTRLVIPASVTIIGSSAFEGNPLNTVLFKGDRPSNVGNSALRLGLDAGSTVAYCEGAKGWPGAAIDGITPIADCDLDGITDAQDAFPRISIGNLTDNDGDGAPDACDQACMDLGMSADVCPATTSGAVVDATGCIDNTDSDLDGVPDWKDNCPLTSSQSNADLNGCETDLSYTLVIDSDEIKAVITGCSDKCAQVAIPNVIDGYTVLGIAESAFRANGLVNFSPSDQISSIGASAFFSNRLVELTLPDSVTSLGSSAFRENNLSTLTLSENLKVIGSSAFRDNALTLVVIPASVTDMGSSVFEGNPLDTVLFMGARPSISGGSLGLNSDGTLAYCEGAEGWPGAAIDGITPIADCDLDGITDAQDAFPRISIGNLTDTDSDGAPDECDQACGDLGMSADAFPGDPAESADLDEDGIGNNADTDADGDGYSNQFELDQGSNPLDSQVSPSALGLSPAVLKVIRNKSSNDDG